MYLRMSIKDMEDDLQKLTDKYIAKKSTKPVEAKSKESNDGLTGSEGDRSRKYGMFA